MPLAALWPVCARPQVVCVPLADVPGVKAGALIFLHVSHLLFDWVKLSNHQSNTTMLGVLRLSARPPGHARTHRTLQAHTSIQTSQDVSHV